MRNPYAKSESWKRWMGRVNDDRVKLQILLLYVKYFVSTVKRQVVRMVPDRPYDDKRSSSPCPKNET
jgi:hypothetical protein